MISTVLLGACETTKTTQKKVKQLYSRVTYYTKHEDKFGNKVACSKKLRAQQGRTVAAHKDFPFGTKCFIPDLKEELGSGPLVVEDRGRAVNAKKAVPRDWRSWMYDFDVYLDCSNRKMRQFAKEQPPYMTVLVEQ
jgi:3D (Asp-Asp-Asp) domain-containing protein